MNWTEGYVADITYTHGYYRELSPMLADFALLGKGLHSSRSADFNYLELGFGQGISANIHAASNPGNFWGIDFNPSHAAAARALADASGSGATFLDSSFAEFANSTDTPQFDYIGLHGIWSWVSDENRGNLLKILRDKLSPGGTVFISYNSTPGWSPMIPIRNLLALHAASNPSGDILHRVDQSIQFVKSLAGLDLGYFKANPNLAKRLDKLAQGNPKYLAHEYFNSDWAPMPFSEVAAELQKAKLTFACSANTLHNVESIKVPEAARKLLAGLTEPALRETVRDFVVNEQFRKDLFQRGPRHLSVLERLARFREMRFALTIPLEELKWKIDTPSGQAELHQAVYKPIAEFLATQEHRPKSGSEIETAVATASITTAQVIEAITILHGMGPVSLAHPEKTVSKVKASTQRLNRHLIALARDSSETQVLASPVLGAGLPVSRFEQIMLGSYLSGTKQKEGWVKYTWQILSSQGQRLMKDNKPVETTEENLALLNDTATQFEKRLPLFRTFGII